MTLLAAALAGLCTALLAARAVGVRWVRLRVSEPTTSSRQAAWLAQAGSELTPLQFWLGSLGGGLVTLALIGVATGAVAVAAVPAATVASLPRAHLARRRAARAAALQRAWPDGLRDLVASIAAGASISQALDHLAAHGPEVLRAVFVRYPSLRRTLGTVAALEVIREEQADPTTDRVIEVLVLAHERGGTIVRTVLEDLTAATTRDVRALEEIRTEGLEMRLNARSVVILPWLVLVLLCIRPGPFRDFYASARGVPVLVIGALMSAFGAGIVRRLGRIDDEPRVFGRASGDAS
jgi:tight adherence protein B